MTSATVTKVVTSQVPGNYSYQNKTEESGGELFSVCLNQTAKQAQQNAVTSPSAPVQSTNRDVQQISGSENRVLMQAETTERPLSEEEQSQLKEALETLEKQAEETVKETLGLDDEEFEQAMSELGLSALQLLQPENLMNLITQVMGSEEVTDLLVMPEVQDLLDGMQQLSFSFTEETGISMEDLFALGMEQTVQEIPMQENLPMDDLQPEAVAPQQVETTEQQMTTVEFAKAEDTGIARESKEVQVEGKEQIAEPGKEAVVQQTVKPETEMDEETTFSETEEMVEVQVETTSETENTGSESKEQQSFSENKEMSFEHVQVQAQNETVTFEGEMKPVVETPVPTLVEPEEILKQIQEFARINVTSDTNTLEMQLNPQNLGKIYIHVTEQAGNVTAQIQTQNEAVKEALESQVAQLRTTLEAQGLKVTEVEVTIASHEFEQNLDGQNMKDEQEAERQEAQMGGRRNLNLNDLSGLQGLMTEEEMLAVQIMKDHGNQVDLTA